VYKQNRYELDGDTIVIPDKDHFVLLKTIKGIKDNVDKMYTLGNDDLQYMRDEFLDYLLQLVDVVNVLHTEKDELTDAPS